MKKEKETTNVVYVKEFENGKVYVGITNNFRSRMSNHKSKAFVSGSKLPVHRAMRKYTHETKIVFKSEDYDEILKKEIELIQEYKDKGIDVYNLTDGGGGAVGYKWKEEAKEKLRQANLGKKHTEETKRKVGLASKGRRHTEEDKKLISEANKLRWDKVKSGELKSSRFKTKEYFENTPVRRVDFKTSCKVHNWDFNDFEEAFSCYHHSPNNKKVKKFTYKALT